jgi:hypothetical protein
MNDSSIPDASNEYPPRLSLAARFLLFSVASVLTLLALGWAIENWRGAKAWSSAKRELLAHGEPLSIERIVPPLPKDDENFAATPLLRDLLDYAVEGTPQSLAWRNPGALARATAVSLPTPRKPPSDRGAGSGGHRIEGSARDGRIDLRAYALGVRLMPRNCPPNLDPELAKRYGYLAPGVNWTKPTNVQTVAAAILDPAQELLEHLQRFDPELGEIEQAVRRPHSQFAIHWSEDFRALLPHLASLKHLTTLFSVRATARLYKHDGGGALADAFTCLRLAGAVHTEPLLISQLVRIGQHAIAVKTIAEGLAAQQWNGEQLSELQHALAQSDFQQDLVRALRGERVLQNNFVDRLTRFRGPPLDAVLADDGNADAMLTLCGWVPGWIRQNQVRLNRYDDLSLRQALDPNWPLNLVNAPPKELLLHQASLDNNSPYAVLGRLLAADCAKTQTKAARALTINRLAIIACALERYRLEHQNFPESLSELTRGYLNVSLQDPMSAENLRYERTPADAESPSSYRLWSVGLNGRDDGGIVLKQDDDAQGDWVWLHGIEP